MHGRSGHEVKKIAALIPTGPLAQSIFKDVVCISYGHGESIAHAVKLGTEKARESEPSFIPRFDPQLMNS